MACSLEGGSRVVVIGEDGLGGGGLGDMAEFEEIIRM